MKQYPKNKDIAHGTLKIDKLIKEGNLTLASKIIRELLPKYPKNKYLQYQLAYINILNNKYEEALEQLEELDEEKNLILKTELYIKLQKEPKELYMYQKYFSNLTEAEIKEKMKYRRYINIYLYLNKKYNPKFRLSKNIYLTPLEKQIYSYNKEEVVKDIIKNHQNPSNDENGKFYPNIDIEKIYNFADITIKNSNIEGVLKYGVETFQFYYPDCGTLRNKDIANGFTVITTLGTKNIITIYPNRVKDEYNLVQCEIQNSQSAKKLIRVKNGLERFNSRYNNQ